MFTLVTTVRNLRRHMFGWVYKNKNNKGDRIMVNAIGSTNQVIDRAKEDSYIAKVAKHNLTKQNKQTEEDKVAFKEMGDKLRVLSDDMASYNIGKAFQQAYDGTATLLAIDPTITGTSLDMQA